MKVKELIERLQEQDPEAEKTIYRKMKTLE